MKKQSSLLLKYIFPIVLISPALALISAEPSFKGNNAVLAGFLNKNQQESIYDSFEDTDEDSVFPTNPMELINVLKSIEAMNGRTDPSAAIDDALEAFESEDKEDFSLDIEN